MKGRSVLVKCEQLTKVIFVPQINGTLRGVTADHWKRDTSLPLFTLGICLLFINLYFFFFNIACSTLIPQANKHKYPNIHIHLAAYLPFVFHKPEVLEVWWTDFMPTSV